LILSRRLTSNNYCDAVVVTASEDASNYGDQKTQNLSEMHLCCYYNQLSDFGSTIQNQVTKQIVFLSKS